MQDLFAARPFERGELRNRHARFRGRDGRRQDLRERLAAKPLVEALPAGRGARHGDGIDAALGHRRQPSGFHDVDGEAGGRPAAGIHTMQPSGSGIEDDREQIAPDAVGHWRDDAHHGVVAAA
jgi:hypothetical protein